MSDNKELQCYVEYDGDVMQIIMWVDFDGDDESEWINVKEVKTNDLWDAITTREDLLDYFGEIYWDSLADYKAGEAKLFEDWLDSE